MKTKTKPTKIEQFDKILQIATPVVCLSGAVMGEPIYAVVVCGVLTVAWAFNWVVRVFM